MAVDRNGNPLAKDNLVRIPVRPIRALQIDPHPDASTALLHVYPDEPGEPIYVTGRVLDITEADGEAVAVIQVDGAEVHSVLDSRLVERIA
jgi:hypothetical protein